MKKVKLWLHLAACWKDEFEDRLATSLVPPMPADCDKVAADCRETLEMTSLEETIVLRKGSDDG